MEGKNDFKSILKAKKYQHGEFSKCGSPSFLNRLFPASPLNEQKSFKMFTYSNYKLVLEVNTDGVSGKTCTTPLNREGENSALEELGLPPKLSGSDFPSG